MARIVKYLITAASIAAISIGAIYVLIAFNSANAEGFYRQPNKVWAHRGYREGMKGVLENSIPAYQKAVELGAKGIEIDIHYDALTKQFIVSHDKPYQLHDGQLLTLETVVTYFGQDIYYWLDFKNLKTMSLKKAEFLSAELLDFLNRHNIRAKVFVESQNPENLAPFIEKGIHASYWLKVNPKDSFSDYWYNVAVA